MTTGGDETAAGGDVATTGGDVTAAGGELAADVAVVGRRGEK